MSARVVKVIEVTKGATREYFTLEGVKVGKLVGGARVKIKQPKRTTKKKVGGVITTPTPKEVKRRRKRQDEKDFSLKARIKHAKENV